MATRADFTDAEWADLTAAPTGAVMWISGIDPGFLARVKESWAAGQAVVNGASTPLQRELAKPVRPAFAQGGVESLRAGTLAAIGAALSALAAKAPEEIVPFQTWIKDIARAVADAAGGVSPAESAAVEEITAAVAATPPGAPSAPAAVSADDPAAAIPAAAVDPTAPPVGVGNALTPEAPVLGIAEAAYPGADAAIGEPPVPADHEPTD
ncbi:MAG: hypothetical protein ACOYEV_13410 [Candidatus Nanopelagicales bacterium]